MSVDVFGIRGQVGGAAGPGSGNPLVAGPVETTTAFTGLRLIEDCHQLSAALQSKDWVSGALAGVATVADAVSLAINPIGELAGMVIGWLIEHLSPLREWLDQLTGDAGEVAGGAATWNNVANHLGTVASQYEGDVASALGQTSSLTTAAYRQQARDTAEHIRATAGLASAISTGLSVASTLVQVVRDLVREAIQDVVSLAVGNIVPTPKLIADISAKVAKWVGVLGTKVKGVVESVEALAGLFRKVDGLLSRLSAAFRRLNLPTTDDLGLALAGLMRGNGPKTPPVMRPITDRLNDLRATRSGNDVLDAARDRLLDRAQRYVDRYGLKMPDDVWDTDLIDPLRRGFVIEAERGGNLPSGFRTFDRLDGDTAVSIKSLDPRSASYARPEALERQLRGYVDAAADFTSTVRGGVRLSSDALDSMVLEVVVPPGALTPAQQGVFDDMVRYASQNDVDLKVVTYP